VIFLLFLYFFSNFLLFSFGFPLTKTAFHCPRVGHFFAGKLPKKNAEEDAFYFFFLGHLMGVILISYTNERESRDIHPVTQKKKQKTAITPTKINNIEAHSHTRP